MLRDFSVGRVTAGLPSVTPDLRLHGDKIQVALHRKRQLLMEDLERTVETTAKDGEMDTTNSLTQMGRTMCTPDIIKRLEKLNSRFIFEVSKAYPDLMGIYTVRHSEGGSQKVFVCGMMNAPNVPEFSIRNFREKKIPSPAGDGNWETTREFVSEIRGWRTVLARLIRERHLTYEAVDRVFEVSRGRDSHNWKLLTRT